LYPDQHFHLERVSQFFKPVRKDVKMSKKAAAGVVSSPSSNSHGNRSVFGVQFNKSPLDSVGFKNEGISLDAAVELLGGHIPPCNDDILDADWKAFGRIS
jgi:hypothetical protein